MPQLLEANPERTTEPNALLRKGVRNVRISQLYRADYEARSLRKVRKLSNQVCNEALKAPVELLPSLVNAFDKLCERERVLLRIPLPASSKAIEPRRVAGSVSYSDVPRSSSLVMSDDSTSSVESSAASPPGPGPAVPVKQ